MSKKLLFIDDHVLRFDQSAGSRTSYNYIRLLLDIGLDVTFIAADFVDDEYYTKHLRAHGVTVLTGWCSRIFWWLWLPLYACKFDYIFFNRPEPTRFFFSSVTRFSKAKTIYQCHDLHFLRLRRQYLLDENPDTFRKSYEYEQLELELIRRTDLFLTFSCLEKELISRRMPGNDAAVVPLYFYERPAPAITDFSSRQGLLYVGGFKHNPNIDAVLWFVREIFPVIRVKCPDAILYIVGNHPPPEITQLAGKDVKVLGFVTDDELSGLYEKVRLTVVPLRFGAGVKGKTVEAASFALPMVSTTIGIEGTGLETITPPTDSPEAFGKRVVELYNCDATLRQCSAQLHEYALNNLTYVAAREKMESILTSLADKEYKGRR